MVGRQYSSLVNDIAKAGGITADFAKVGAVAVAVLGERWYNNTAVPLRITDVVLSVGTAPTGAAMKVDVAINGTTIYAAAGDRASIAISGFKGNGVPTKTGDAIVVRPGQYVTAEVTVVGSTVAGADLAAVVRLA